MTISPFSWTRDATLFFWFTFAVWILYLVFRTISNAVEGILPAEPDAPDVVVDAERLFGDARDRTVMTQEVEQLMIAEAEDGERAYVASLREGRLVQITKENFDALMDFGKEDVNGQDKH